MFVYSIGPTGWGSFKHKTTMENATGTANNNATKILEVKLNNIGIALRTRIVINNPFDLSCLTVFTSAKIETTMIAIK